MKNLFIIAMIVVFATGCKKETTEPEPELTSQKCMDENGPAFFLNSEEQCEWSQVLSLCNSGDHWKGGGWPVTEPGYFGAYMIGIEFFRDGSNTSGTGKTKCEDPYNCFGSTWVGNFSWKKDPYNSKILLVTSSDANFDKYSSFSTMSEIKPNTSSPTTFTAWVTTSLNTNKMTFTKVSGTFQ
jgi:hypothetical protein